MIGNIIVDYIISATNIEVEKIFNKTYCNKSYFKNNFFNEHYSNKF